MSQYFILNSYVVPNTMKTIKFDNDTYFSLEEWAQNIFKTTGR